MEVKPIVLVSGRLPAHLQTWLEEIAKPRYVIKEEEVEQFTIDERKNIQGLFTYGHFHVDKHMLDLLPDLKVVSNFGVGVDHIDSEEASKRKISVLQITFQSTYL